MQKFNYIIWAVVVLVLINSLIGLKIQTDIKYYENNIKNLQTKIDSVNILNKGLDAKLDSLYKNIETIDISITEVKSNIETIKKDTNEKINSVNDFTFSELEQFFTDRYSNRLNNTSESTNR